MYCIVCNKRLPTDTTIRPIMTPKVRAKKDIPHLLYEEF